MHRLGLALIALTAAARLGAQAEGSVLATMPGSTRAAALGEVGAALAGDAAALLTNPAAAVPAGRLALEGSFERYLADAAVSSGAVAGRLGGGPLVAALGVQALDYGAEDEIVPDPATGGRRGMRTGRSFDAGELIVASSLAYRRGALVIGGAVKYAHRHVADWSADGWAGDLGMTLGLKDGVIAGVSVQNLGGDLGDGGRLPRLGRAGIAARWHDVTRPWWLLGTAELQWPSGESLRLAAGAEAGLTRGDVALVGRLGYAARPAGSDAAPVTVGGAVVIGTLALDYAYRDFDLLGGGTHRLGLRWTR
ncbi:MAG: hypothetical protein ACREMV_05095 [Gemmatimonadales bacterium]